MRSVERTEVIQTREYKGFNINDQHNVKGESNLFLKLPLRVCVCVCVIIVLHRVILTFK